VQVRELGHQNICVEQVIQSNGTFVLSDMTEKYGIDTASFAYQVEPQLGYYCIWKRRQPDSPGPFADCENITATLTVHAKLLATAGIDYVVVDGTNWPTPSEQTDVMLQRPTEVLLEEWLSLRESNISTPQIAMWMPVWKGSTMWKTWLQLLSAPAYKDIILRDSAGKQVSIHDTITVTVFS